MSELRTLAEFITGLSYDQVPARVRETAVSCILDSVGVGVGAAGNEQIRSVSEAWIRKSGRAEREIDVWGQHRKAPLSTAVFLNAMMSHTLELDEIIAKARTKIGFALTDRGEDNADCCRNCQSRRRRKHDRSKNRYG